MPTLSKDVGQLQSGTGSPTDFFVATVQAFSKPNSLLELFRYSDITVSCQISDYFDFIQESHGSPLLVQDSGEPYQFIQYGIMSWDLIGLLIKRKNVRISTNLSGEYLASLHVSNCFSTTIQN